MITFLLLLICLLIIAVVLFIIGLPILPIVVDLLIFVGIIKLLFFRKKKG